MPRGDKRKYTGKQKRQAGHIAERYEEKGGSEPEAERSTKASAKKAAAISKHRDAA